MEAWLIFIGVLVLMAFIASGYISRQLSDKDTDKIQSQSILPGSTQSSMPVKVPQTKKRTYDRGPGVDPKDFDIDKNQRKRKTAGVFRSKNDIKRAIILNEILNKKSE